MITQKELKELLHYEPETGTFIWKVTRNGFVKEGDEAGNISSTTGYRKIRINYKEYSAHRLAWLYIKGYFPEYEIDHMNGVRHDNNWSNLRHVTRVCNLQNLKVRKTNTSGFPGVSYEKEWNKWKAYICINSRTANLGRYNSALEAALARYTVEVQCPKWACNHRSELVKAIQKEWTDFQIKQ